VSVTKNTIRDEIRVDAPASRVYEALTTQSGYRGWWNAVAEIDGAEARLHFVKGGQPVRMRFRIDQTNGERVRWSCVDHDMPSWVGTTLDWRIADIGDGTLVAFEHAGWQGAPPDMVVQGWKHFLASLGSYVETGAGQPW
jgi:uncharacterized protein YndB with AHSA1/START domain